jgi:ribonuclease HI
LADADAVVVYTDGACSGNPGPGGWCARIKYPDGRIRELGNAESETTNNRMEMRAAIEGLGLLQEEKEKGAITVVTDSEYVRKGITEWIHGWKRRGWRTAAKKPVLNKDLWSELDRLNTDRVRWQYTRGHAGDEDNERCDDIAQAFAQGMTLDLIQPT